MVYRREKMLAHDARFDAQNAPGCTERIERAKLFMNDILVQTTEMGPEEYCNVIERYVEDLGMKEVELPLTRVMSGNTLQYSDTPYDRGDGDQNFLVFRDRCHRIAFGIPATVHRPAASPPFASLSTATVGTYDDVNEIQVECLVTIRQRRKITVRGHIYEVRFTKDREPIVLVSDGAALTSSLQTRLNNLWTIEYVQQLLNELRARAFRSTEEDLHRLGRISEDMQSIYVTAMVALNAKVDEECAKIEDMLYRFEFLSNPGTADQQSFKQLKEKITLLDSSQRWVKTRMGYVKEQIETMHDHVDPTYLVSLFDRVTSFILTKAGI